MKPRTILKLSMAAIALSALSIHGFAAPPGPPPGGPGPRGGGGGGPDGSPRQFLGMLTPEERQQFETAMKKAMPDPAVGAARKERDTVIESTRGVMKDAMLKQDPSLAPVLEKLKKAMPPRLGGEPPQPPPSAADKDKGDGSAPGGESPKGEGAGRGPGKGGPPHPMKGDGMLTPEEKQKMHAAHDAVQNDPQVKAAEEKRRDADKKFGEVLRAQMLKDDPSIAPVLAKVEAAIKEREAGKAPGAGKEGDEKTPPAPPANP